MPLSPKRAQRRKRERVDASRRSTRALNEWIDRSIDEQTVPTTPLLGVQLRLNTPLRTTTTTSLVLPLSPRSRLGTPSNITHKSAGLSLSPRARRPRVERDDYIVAASLARSRCGPLPQLLQALLGHRDALSNPRAIRQAGVGSEVGLDLTEKALAFHRGKRLDALEELAVQSASTLRHERRW